MIVKKAIKDLIRRFIYGSKADANCYVKHLRKIGIAVGEGIVIYDPISNVIDEQNPKLITIGNNVRISHGVVILTHDYSWSVIAGKYGECLGGVAPVRIGNNVFVGMNAVITKGCEIGDNVIIGAGSIVTKNCDCDSVYAGTPARKIMTLEELYYKRKSKQLEDVKRIIDQLQSIEEPSPYLREYAHLFADKDSKETIRLEKDTGYYEECRNFYKSYKRPFYDLDELIKRMRNT